jgi:hypothetical protein
VRLEVALPARPLVVVHGHHERILEVERDRVELPQYDRVGVQNPVGERRARVEIDPAAQPSALVEPVALHERRRVQAPQVVRHQSGPDRLLLECRREDHRHHEVDQGAVPVDDDAVGDGFDEFGRRRQPVTHDRANRSTGFGIALPVSGELTQRELAAERELTGLEQRLHVEPGLVMAHCCTSRGSSCRASSEHRPANWGVPHRRTATQLHL